ETTFLGCTIRNRSEGNHTIDSVQRLEFEVQPEEECAVELEKNQSENGSGLDGVSNSTWRMGAIEPLRIPAAILSGVVEWC
ncbi:MAG: hypothetical protein WCA91_02060, partial [Candidatus Acidiferrales bacterium]